MRPELMEAPLSDQKYKVPRGAFPALVSEELTLDFRLTSEWQVPES